MRNVVHTLRGLGSPDVPAGSFPAPSSPPSETAPPPRPAHLGASVDPPFAPPVLDDSSRWEQQLRVDLPRTSWVPAVAIGLGALGLLALIVAALLPSSQALGLAPDAAAERVAPLARSAGVAAEKTRPAPRVTPSPPARPKRAAPEKSAEIPQKGTAASRKPTPSSGPPASKAKKGRAPRSTELYGRR